MDMETMLTEYQMNVSLDLESLMKLNLMNLCNLRFKVLRVLVNKTVQRYLGAPVECDWGQTSNN